MNDDHCGGDDDDADCMTYLVDIQVGRVRGVLTRQQSSSIPSTGIVVWARHSVVRVGCGVPKLLLRHQCGAPNACCTMRAGLAVLHSRVK